MDTSIDKQMIHELIEKELLHKMPVRSGNLASSIFGSMHITRMQYYGSHFFGHGTYKVPSDQPTDYIKGTIRHTPPDTGYGKWKNVDKTYPIPNVTMIKISKSGLSAKYLLNDPGAYPEPKKIVNQEFKRMLVHDYWSRFIRVMIGVKI